jgi:hypothetical protein
MANGSFFEPTVNDLKSKFNNAKNSIQSLQRSLGLVPGNPWPQTRSTSELGLLGSSTKGFLPPVLITPTSQSGPGGSSQINNNFEPYLYIDWRGHFLQPGAGFEQRVSDIEKKFNKSGQLPSTDLKSNPYSTRDTYSIFGDFGTDYFKHGLQVLNDINADFTKTESSNSRLSSFRTTPYEQNDPVIFGFDIIFDSQSSPLLNGSVLDFINKFGPQISEIAARKNVYEEFKQQFVKFFKTNASVQIDNANLTMTGVENNVALTETNDGILSPGKKAYLNYYLKKISGLEKLSESNSSTAFKYLADYKSDIVTLDFAEDVSLSIGTLAHLYKLLYWSKPNGKSMIPENLLRFNCDIIVSEVRNFNRVRRAVDTGNLEVVKDNVSRWVYSLRECQFYFTSLPHDSTIDLGGIKTYDIYSGLQFNYKYSTVKFEKWVANNNWGRYVGYNNGAIWKIGNPGARTNSGSASTPGTTTDKSFPKFFTTGSNTFAQNGVTTPFVTKNFFPNAENQEVPNSSDTQTNVDNQEANEKSKVARAFNKFKDSSKKKAAEALRVAENSLIQSATRQLQSQINSRVALLNASLNKILNSAGVSRISPPRNIYTGETQNAASRIFYDVRGDLINFLGSGLGAQFAGGSQTIVTP